jgi:hypothetical protein
MQVCIKIYVCISVGIHVHVHVHVNLFQASQTNLSQSVAIELTRQYFWNKLYVCMYACMYRVVYVCISVGMEQLIKQFFLKRCCVCKCQGVCIHDDVDDGLPLHTMYERKVADRALERPDLPLYHVPS